MISFSIHKQFISTVQTLLKKGWYHSMVRHGIPVLYDYCIETVVLI